MQKNQINILLISENDAELVSLSKKLKDEGYQTGPVVSPSDSLPEFEKLKPQVVVFSSGVKSGYQPETLLKIKKPAPGTFVILHLMKPEIESAIHAVNNGLADKIITGLNCSDEIVNFIGIALKEGDLPASHPQTAADESSDLLKKYNEILQSNLKARSQSILQKKLKLESINYELQSNLFETIKALFSYLERKNQWIGRHSKMVAVLSYELSVELKLPNKLSEMIEIAGLLHDVGKSGIPDKIVSRATHLLTVQQAEMVAKHVFIGKELLDPIVSLKDVGDMILYHHENYDGKGYPHKLIGEAIPIGARIIAVANTFNNLMEKFHQRAQDTYVKSIKDLESKAGTVLDPALTGLFIEMMNRNLMRQVVSKNEIAILITGLAPGMMLARDIFSTRGTNVLRKGQVLSAGHIEYVKEFDRIEKIMGEVFVYE